jgi:hypothetical protein
MIYGVMKLDMLLQKTAPENKKKVILKTKRKIQTEEYVTWESSS